jgi:hypothetical protein
MLITAVKGHKDDIFWLEMRIKTLCLTGWRIRKWIGRWYGKVTPTCTCFFAFYNFFNTQIEGHCSICHNTSIPIISKKIIVSKTGVTKHLWTSFNALKDWHI